MVQVRDPRAHDETRTSHFQAGCLAACETGGAGGMTGGATSDGSRAYLRKKDSAFQRGRSSRSATSMQARNKRRLNAIAASRSTGWRRSSEGAWYRSRIHSRKRRSSVESPVSPKVTKSDGTPARTRLYWSLRTKIVC